MTFREYCLGRHSEILFMIPRFCLWFFAKMSFVHDLCLWKPKFKTGLEVTHTCQDWYFRVEKKTHQKWYGKLSWHFLFTVKLIWTFPHCILAIHCCSNCISLSQWIITIGPARLVSLRNISFLNLSIPSYRNSKGTLLPFSLINHHLSHRSHVVSTNKCT